MKNTIKRRIEISIETHEIKIIRISGGANPAFCEHCGTQTSSFTSEQIAGLLKIAVGEVWRDVEAGRFHLIGNDRTKICGDSFRHLQK